MHLASALTHRLEAPGLSLNERTALSCRLAKHLEAAGDYEAAQAAMSEVWEGIGSRPNLENLDEETGAEVLLRVGSLTGWLGSVNKIKGSQEAAKDLISKSLRTLQRLRLKNKVGEARSDLALCYWRAGAFDEARVMLEEALREFGERDIEPKAITLLRMAEVERASQRLSESLRIYNAAAQLFDYVQDILLVAHFHHGYANVLNQLSAIERNREYVDRALMEYTAAGVYFEQAGHERYQACVENNLGVLCSRIGKFDEAHEHLDRCQVLLTKIADTLRLGQLDETRARVFLAEGKIIEAEKVVRSAVAALGAGDDALLFTEALITHGITLARLGHQSEAQVSFEQAMNVAERAGDFGSAGLAALTLIEEVTLSPDAICQTLEHTRTLLDKVEDADTLRRLTKVAFRGLFESQKISLPTDWENFHLRRAVHGYESNLIAMALRDCDGSVTKAAHLLGFKHHQSLSAIIAARHKELLDVRRPLRPRRKTVMQHPKKRTMQ